MARGLVDKEVPETGPVNLGGRERELIWATRSDLTLAEALSHVTEILTKYRPFSPDERALIWAIRVGTRSDRGSNRVEDGIYTIPGQEVEFRSQLNHERILAAFRGLKIRFGEFSMTLDESTHQMTVSKETLRAIDEREYGRNEQMLDTPYPFGRWAQTLMRDFGKEHIRRHGVITAPRGLLRAPDVTILSRGVDSRIVYQTRDGVIVNAAGDPQKEMGRLHDAEIGTL